MTTIAIADREIRVNGRIVRAGTQVTVRVPPRDRLRRITVRSINANGDLNCWLNHSYRTFALERVVCVHRDGAP